jgi:hypothetical protein
VLILNWHGSYICKGLYLDNRNKPGAVTVVTLDYTTYDLILLRHVHSYGPDYIRNDDLCTPRDEHIIQSRLAAIQRTKTNAGVNRVKVGVLLLYVGAHLYGR